MLSRQPSNPGRVYLCWQRKLQIQLDALLAVARPDSRTKMEIHQLRVRLGNNLKRYNRNAKIKRRRELRKANGLCIACPKRSPGGFSYCPGCRRKHRDEERLRRRKP